jgi:hypothetical protein
MSTENVDNVLPYAEREARVVNRVGCRLAPFATFDSSGAAIRL